MKKAYRYLGKEGFGHRRKYSMCHYKCAKCASDQTVVCLSTNEIAECAWCGTIHTLRDDERTPVTGEHNGKVRKER